VPGAAAERRSLRAQVGMRRVEVAGRQLRVNGRPILLKGVNRHEHDERRGKAVTEAGMVRDIQLLKQFNFNSVRCAHYPNHPRWRAPAPRAAAPAQSGRLAAASQRQILIEQIAQLWGKRVTVAGGRHESGARRPVPYPNAELP
jgi:hypothetical protein